MESDADLIQRVLDGEMAAYADIVQRYERLVRAIAIGATRDHHRAEDIAQEAFVEAYRSLGSLRDASCFAAWLMRITDRVVARQVRSAVRVPVPAGDIEIESEGDDCLLNSKEQIAALVSRLPNHERVVVGLRHFEGLSVNEVAQRLSRPVGTVTRQLSRAHSRLRGWWQKEERS